MLAKIIRSAIVFSCGVCLVACSISLSRNSALHTNGDEASVLHRAAFTSGTGPVVAPTPASTSQDTQWLEIAIALALQVCTQPSVDTQTCLPEKLLEFPSAVFFCAEELSAIPVPIPKQTYDQMAVGCIENRLSAGTVVPPTPPTPNPTPQLEDHVDLTLTCWQDDPGDAGYYNYGAGEYEIRPAFITFNRQDGTELYRVPFSFNDFVNRHLTLRFPDQNGFDVSITANLCMSDSPCPDPLSTNRLTRNADGSLSGTLQIPWRYDSSPQCTGTPVSAEVQAEIVPGCEWHSWRLAGTTSYGQYIWPSGPSGMIENMSNPTLFILDDAGDVLFTQAIPASDFSNGQHYSLSTSFPFNRSSYHRIEICDFNGSTCLPGSVNSTPLWVESPNSVTSLQIPVMSRTVGADCSAFEIQTGGSPLVLDLTGEGLSFSNPQTSHVVFDLQANGHPVHTGWVQSPNAAFLVRDLNGNGIIDSGAELFGNYTRLPDGTRAANGFEALKALDGNQDGYFTPEDAAWKTVKLWIDKNYDGKTDPGELISLEDAGIRYINLNYQTIYEVDLFGNETKQRSTFVSPQGFGLIVDIWFKFF